MSKEKWLIAIGGSDADDVIIYETEGNQEEIKKLLLTEFVNNDRKNNPEGWDFGTENTSEVQMRDDGSLYAFGCYRDFHHFDYVARRVNSLRKLGPATLDGVPCLNLKEGDKVYEEGCYGDLFEKTITKIIDIEQGLVETYEKSINRTKVDNVSFLYKEVPA